MMNSYAKELDFVLTEQEMAQLIKVAAEWRFGGSEVSMYECSFYASMRHFGYLQLPFASFANQGTTGALELALPYRIHDPIQCIWFRLATYSLPLLLMYGENDQIARFCQPYRLTLDPGYTGRFDRDFTLVYLLMCNFLKTEREIDTSLRQALLHCRKKQVVLLVDALLAAVEGTQSQFDKAFMAGMKYFRSRNKSYNDRRKKQFDLIALEYTSVNGIARRFGKTMPELPVNLACSILTRESIDNPVP